MAYVENLEMMVKGRDMRPFFLRIYSDILREARTVYAALPGTRGVEHLAFYAYHTMSLIWGDSPIRDLGHEKEKWISSIDSFLLEFGNKCAYEPTEDDFEVELDDGEKLGPDPYMIMMSPWLKEKTVDLLSDMKSIVSDIDDDDVKKYEKLLSDLISDICSANLVLGTLPKEVKLPYGIDMKEWFYDKYGSRWMVFDDSDIADYYVADEMKEMAKILRQLRKREKALEEFVEAYDALPGEKFEKDIHSILELVWHTRIEDERLSLIEELYQREKRIERDSGYTTWGIGPLVDSIVNEIRWVPWGGITLGKGENAEMWDALINEMMMHWLDKKLSKKGGKGFLPPGISPDMFMSSLFGEDDDDDDDGNLKF